MKRRAFAIMMCLVLAVSLTNGCGEKKSPETKTTVEKEKKEENKEKAVSKEQFEKDQKAFLQKTGEDLVKEYVKDNQGKATKEEFRKLLENSRYFKSDRFEWAVSIPDNFKEAEKIIAAAGGCTDNREAVYGKLYDAPYPYERLYTYIVLNTRAFGEGVDLLPYYETIMKNETVPELQSAMMKGLGNYSENPDVMAYFKKASKDSHPEVRQAAAFVTKGVKYGNKDAVEILKTLMKDPDLKVRIQACHMAGNLNDDSLIPLLKENLYKDGYKISGSVGHALCQMWMHVTPESPKSAEAYKVYMEYLKKTPRKVTFPSFMFISASDRGGLDRETWIKDLEAQGYFNRADMTEALKNIVTDEVTGYNTKNSAVHALATYGTKADLESLKEYIQNADFSDSETLQKNYAKLVAEYSEKTPR